MKMIPRLRFSRLIPRMSLQAVTNVEPVSVLPGVPQDISVNAVPHLALIDLTQMLGRLSSLDFGFEELQRQQAKLVDVQQHTPDAFLAADEQMSPDVFDFVHGACEDTKQRVLSVMKRMSVDLSSAVRELCACPWTCRAHVRGPVWRCALATMEEAIDQMQYVIERAISLAEAGHPAAVRLCTTDEELREMIAEINRESDGGVKRAPKDVDFISQAMAGSRVRLHEIQGRPDLNSKVGTLVSFDQTKQRWQVEVG